MSKLLQVAFDMQNPQVGIATVASAYILKHPEVIYKLFLQLIDAKSYIFRLVLSYWDIQHGKILI